MALTLTGVSQWSTGQPTHIWYNQSQATQFYRIKINSATPGAIPNGLGVLARNIFDFTHGWVPGNTPSLNINLSGVNGAASAGFPLAIGQTYAVMNVWTSGLQTVYINGIPTVIGHISGNTTTRVDPIALGPNIANTAIVYTLDDVWHWDGAAGTQSDAAYLTNNGDPTTILTSATYRSRWTLSGTTGANAAIGDAGLKNAYASGDGSDFATHTGSGTAVYAPSLVWVPTVTANPYVAGCGKVIAATLTANSDGSLQTLSQLLKIPSITVNGVNQGPLVNPWVTQKHQCFFASTPLVNGVPLQINPGDVVSLTADPVWANTTGGGVGAFSGTIDNRVGKSSTQVELLTKTLRMGFNNSAPGTLEYYPYKNLKFLTGLQPNFGKFSPGTYTVTNVPCETGLWMLVWDALKPTTPAMMSLTTSAPSLVKVTPLPQYSVDPTDGSGRGYVRVYDVEPVAGSAWQTTLNGFNVSLTYADPAYTGTPNYDNLWIQAPGDVSIVNGQAVVDRSDPFALSSYYLDRLTPNVGSIRWVDLAPGGSTSETFAYPELLPDMHSENWWGNHITEPPIGYQSVGPLDITAYPYMYHWSFGRPGHNGSTFPATLAPPGITTAPAVGTHETYTFSDAATAPLMAGLEIQVDNEVMRILSVSGTSVTLYRGSNGTTPATHSAGTVTVFGRLPITAKVNSNGLVPTTVTCLVTTSVNHGMVTRQTLAQQGLAIKFTCTSGLVVNNYPVGVNGFYVTGANTFVSVSQVAGTPAAGDKPNGVYNLTGAYGQNFHFKGSGVPYEIQAITTGKFPFANYHVNIPVDAVDDMVYVIAKKVLANFPAGRKIYIEYTNEPWNFGGAFGGFAYCDQLGPLAIPLSYTNFYPITPPNGPNFQAAYYCTRATQVHQIFRTVFSAAGRGSEIVGIANCQMGQAPTQATPHLNLALSLGRPLDAIACAPYYSMSYSGVSAYPATVAAFNLYDDDQACDMLLHDFTYDPSPDHQIGSILSNANAVQAYNQQNGKSCILMGYEGGIEMASPVGANFRQERAHDIRYNPLFYHVEQGWYALLQKYGFDHLHIYGLGIFYGTSGETWGVYHGRTQKHSRGDGLNGAANNRLLSVNPSSPNYIGGGIPLYSGTQQKQDLLADSVRGEAYRDWNTPPPAPPAPAPKRRKRFLRQLGR